mmetsp:Transcript_22644/g.36645  ORF Transcript_22644/g.36645 Transcript_22644/m.36645 type:complete len:93 (+) Transcript_22644:513-791(+)
MAMRIQINPVVTINANSKTYNETNRIVILQIPRPEVKRTPHRRMIPIIVSPKTANPAVIVKFPFPKKQGRVIISSVPVATTTCVTNAELTST